MYILNIIIDKLLDKFLDFDDVTEDDRLEKFENIIKYQQQQINYLKSCIEDINNLLVNDELVVFKPDFDVDPSFRN